MMKNKAIDLIEFCKLIGFEMTEQQIKYIDAIADKITYTPANECLKRGEGWKHPGK